MPQSTGGVFDPVLDALYVLEGDWAGDDAVIHTFFLCPDCNRWYAESGLVTGRVQWSLGFRDRCRCPWDEHLWVKV